jgi:hypothetical protein
VKALFSEKDSNEYFTNPKSAFELKLLNFWLLKTKLKDEKDGVMIIEPEDWNYVIRSE